MLKADLGSLADLDDTVRLCLKTYTQSGKGILAPCTSVRMLLSNHLVWVLCR